MGVRVTVTKEPLLVKVPMKPYVVKFLKNNFGENHKTSRWSWLGKKAVDLLTDTYRKPPKLNYSSSFSFMIPYTVCLKHGHFIDYNKYQNLADFCERLFKDFMFSHVYISVCTDQKSNAMLVLKNFLKFYDISEEELKLDSAYRDYLRYLESKNNNKTTKNKALNKAS